MPGLALGVGFFMYATFYYGLSQVQGGNDGFWDLLIPGHYKARPKDTPNPSAGGSASGLPGFGLGSIPVIGPLLSVGNAGAKAVGSL